MKPLYWNTVTNTLRQVLEKLMAEPLFALFRLVGNSTQPTTRAPVVCGPGLVYGRTI